MLLSTLALAGDSQIKTWKRNAARTRVAVLPFPEATSDVLTIQPLKNSLKVSWSTVDTQGRTIHGEFTANYDGREYPIKGNADADTVSVRRIDEKTTDYSYKRGGKEVMRERAVIAADGTLTLTQTCKNAKGEEFTVITHWDRR